MARVPQETDFTVKVDGVGTFTFGKRTMRDEIAIQVEFARLIDGVEPTSWLQAVCGWLSVLKVITVRAPDGWDLDEMDPLDDATYARMNAVHSALIDKERSFRRGTKPASEAAGS
jgi:hypothetical protein